LRKLEGGVAEMFDFEHYGENTLVTIVESATGFGLEPGEIWETMLETVDCLPEDARATYIDELTRRLAERLLQKERSF
jgi:hypothetical protein